MQVQLDPQKLHFWGGKCLFPLKNAVFKDLAGNFWKKYRQRPYITPTHFDTEIVQMVLV